MRRLLADLGRAALDLAYPHQCGGCSQRLVAPDTARGICATCYQSLAPVRPPFCMICAEPFPGLISDDFSCPNCDGKPHEFEFAVAAWLSKGVLRDMIHRFKYNRSIDLRRPLAGLLATALEDERLRGVDWLLVPVPLHHTRFRERHYNQAHELCLALNNQYGLPWRNALRRTRATERQAQLGRKDRLKNLRNAFCMRPWFGRMIRGRDVLLIDDVLTTGATAAACARILKEKGGARRVVVATVARG